MIAYLFDGEAMVVMSASIHLKLDGGRAKATAETNERELAVLAWPSSPAEDIADLLDHVCGVFSVFFLVVLVLG